LVSNKIYLKKERDTTYYIIYIYIQDNYNKNTVDTVDNFIVIEKMPINNEQKGKLHVLKMRITIKLINVSMIFKKPFFMKKI